MFDAANTPPRYVSLDFCEAVYRALAQHGMRLLDEPRRMLAIVSDICNQESSGFKLFEHTCDFELLEPFAALRTSRMDEDSLDDAAHRAYLRLRDRSIEARAAESLCLDLRNAIARTYRLPDKRLDLIPNQAAEDSEHDKIGVDPLESASTRVITRSSIASASVRDNQNRVLSDSLGASVAPPQTGSMGLTYVAAPSVPQYDSQQGGKQKAGFPALVVVLVALILAIGGVSYALITGSQEKEGEDQTQTATVSFAGGKNATGKMGAVMVDEGDEYNLPTCAYSRKGYEFDCWVDEDGEEYTPGETVAVYKDVCFTVQWAKKGEDTSASDDKHENGQDGDEAATKPRDTGKAETAKTNENSQRASSFPRTWTGTYGGRAKESSDGTISRQVSFDFRTISSSGELGGICYVGVDDAGAGATAARYNIEGTVDWNSGEIYLYGTTWIEKGGLAYMRRFEGTVNFAKETMTGRAGDVDDGANSGDWQMRRTDKLVINVPDVTPKVEPRVPTYTPVPTQPRDENPTDSPTENPTDSQTNSRANTFPRVWSGHYDGWTSDGETGDVNVKIERSVEFGFESVLDNGDLEGYCYVGRGDNGPGATQASYYISGHVDWDTGTIYVAGTKWIDQGGLDDLRQYEGTVDFSNNTITGIASDVGTHEFEGGFSMSPEG